MRSMFGRGSTAAIVVALVFSFACGGDDPSTPVAPSPTPPAINADVAPAGLDVTEKRLVDGAGNPSPLRIRLTFVYPAPGATINPAPVVLGDGPRDRVFHYRAEVCMDSVPNPQNSTLLSSVQVRGYWSQDGVRPINLSADSAVQVISGVVTPDNCVRMQRLPPGSGGTRGQEWVFFDPPGAKYLIFGAKYGPGQFFALSDAPCPSLEVIAMAPAQNRPQCVLRSSHFLNYNW